MEELWIAAISPDRLKRLVITQRSDGLYLLHEQRLLDLDDRGQYEEPAEIVFPEDDHAFAPNWYLLDTSLNGLYGSKEDAHRAAEWIIRI